MARPVIHTCRAAKPWLPVNSYPVDGESVIADTNLVACDIGRFAPG